MRASSVSGSMSAARGSSPGQRRSAAALPLGPARPRHEESRSLWTQRPGSEQCRAPLRRQRAPCWPALPFHHELTAQGQRKARDAEGCGRKRKEAEGPPGEGHIGEASAGRGTAPESRGRAETGRAGLSRKNQCYWQVKPLPVQRTGTSGGRRAACPLKGHGPAGYGACAVSVHLGRGVQTGSGAGQ